jgi:hypothetical protein
MRLPARRRRGRLAEYDEGMGALMVASLSDNNASDEEAYNKLVAAPLDFGDWPDDEIAELISRNPNSAPAMMAASELRVRESWRSPDKWALIVAGVSLIVSAGAIVRTL